VRLAFDSSLFAVPFYQNQVPALAVATVIDGVVSSIAMQNNGSGYAARPLVTIVGNGAGAKARAIWSPETGAVSGIEVLDGGSGYWRIPNATMTTGVYPVSPQNQGALVVISTGYVENLLYR
jgi:3-mercaptopyruvate sulfurtransferase SseA